MSIEELPTRTANWDDPILTRFVPCCRSMTTMAEIAERIDAEQKINGYTIPFPDLLIGATALSLGYSVLTSNLRHFQMIPGLAVIAF